MDKINVDANINFQRAMYLLEERMDTPEYMITIWRMVDCFETIPWPEKCKPWYYGLEDLI